MRLDRARLGLFTKAGKPQVQLPHVDKFDKPHKSIVFLIFISIPRSTSNFDFSAILMQ